MAAYGQHDFGFKANGGFSYFTTKLESNPLEQKTDIFYIQPSAQVGFFYNYNFKEKLSIGTEVLFIPIHGKEYLYLAKKDQNGNLTGDYKDEYIYRHIYYLGIPVYFSSSFKKLNINLGFLMNFALGSDAEEMGHGSHNGQYYTLDRKVDKLGINKYDFGARSGAAYKLSEVFSVETNYYFGLTNILNLQHSSINWKWKVQQVTIGLRYKLFSSNTKKSKSEKK